MNEILAAALEFQGFAGRARDWEDIKGVLSRNGARLDLTYVRAQLAPLLEALENPEAMERFERLVRTHIR